MDNKTEPILQVPKNGSGLPFQTIPAMKDQLKRLPQKALTTEERRDLVVELFKDLPSTETLKNMEFNKRLQLTQEISEKHPVFCYGFMRTFMWIMNGDISQNDVVRALNTPRTEHHSNKK